jgi:putative membrane protein
MTHHDDDSHVFEIVRPDPKLWTYYILSSFIIGPFFWVALIPLYFRYHTLHYRFDQEGISMGWGILFRREIHLTYTRIQDIHLVANFVERWLGLARIQIQTASGSASAEMTLEGLLETERVRDFLYSRMRGARDVRASRGAADPHGAGTIDRVLPSAGAAPTTGVAAAATDAGAHDLAVVLAEVAAELRGVRQALEAARDRNPRDARG